MQVTSGSRFWWENPIHLIKLNYLTDWLNSDHDDEHPRTGAKERQGNHSLQCGQFEDLNVTIMYMKQFVNRKQA